MVQDVAYEKANVPGIFSGLLLKMMSSQIEGKVGCDILKLKPIEFAQNCSVPCVFIIGKKDKLVFPNRVLEIFKAYLGKQKSLIHSEGDHSSEREIHVLGQCYNFIIHELNKDVLRAQNRDEYKNDTINMFLDEKMKNFELQFKDGIKRETGQKKYQNRQSNKINNKEYNFDLFFDEARNEQTNIDQQQNVTNSRLPFFNFASEKKIRNTKSPNFDFSNIVNHDQSTILSDYDVSLITRKNYLGHVDDSFRTVNRK